MARLIDWTVADRLREWATDNGDEGLVELVDTAAGYPTAWRADEVFWSEDRQDAAVAELAELLDDEGGAFWW